MSETILNITPTTTTTTTMISNQYTDVRLNSNERTSMNTINVNDDRRYQRDREKGERENKEDHVQRTRQINENTHSVTSFTNEQDDNFLINTNTMTNYISSYPSLNRYYTSPSRPKYYFDNFDYDIINEEIIEIIYFDHYPTLIERWGDDTKTIIKQQGEYQIEDYVEFDEIEPTIIEEISYEIIYSDNQIQSTREIHHSRSESRNFRKIRKRRTKRQRSTQSIHSSSHSIQTSNNNLINEKTLVENFQSDEQKKEYDNKIQKDINQSHISFNNIDSRRKSSINEINKKQTEQQSIVLEVNQKNTNENFIQSIHTTNDDISFRTTNQDLNSFLKSLLSHLILDSFDEEITNDQQQNSQSTIKFKDEILSEFLTEQIETNPFILIKDEKQFDLDNLSTITDSKETIVPSNSSVMLSNNPLLSTEIKTETGYTAEKTDEKLITNLIDEVNKQQPETIFIQSRRPEEELSQQTYDNKNESITIKYVNETADTIIPDEQQSLMVSKIKEDENIEYPSDFLVEIVHQIRTTSSTNYLSSINHTEQVNEESTKYSSIETTEQNNTTSTSTVIPEKIEIIPLSTHTNAQTNSNSSIPNSPLNELDISSSPVVSESSYSVSELTNIMNSILNLPTKTSSEVLSNIPQQSPTIEQISSENFYIPEPPTSSETDFTNLYQHRYFPFTTIEQTLAQFTPTDNEQLDEKSSASDLTKIYYELQEQRHIRPVLNEIEKEEKQEMSDVNLNNHIDINSFSFISNLPSKEYHQVFGVSDEIINTVDDLTCKVDQVLQGSFPNEKSQIIEASEDHQSIISTDQEEPIHETAPSITSNAELDFRYTSLLDRINTLIKPLLDLQSTSSTTENEFISSNLTDIVSNVFTNLLTETDSEVIQSKSSEEKEVDEQQKPSSTGLFETVKNLFSSTIATETSVENIQPIVETQQQEATIEKLVDNSESSNIITKLTSVQNVLSTSSTFDIDTKEQPKVSQISAQSSTPNQKENHSVFDLVVNAISDVKETILNFGSSDEKTLSDIPGKSINDIQESEILDNDEKQQQTLIESVEETVDNVNEKSLPMQEQLIKISQSPTNSNYPWHSSQYKIATTEHDHLSSIHLSSSIDYKQQDDIEKKPSSEQFQAINDDYPWYSNHYTIVDAEARFARLYQQISSITKQEYIIRSSNVTKSTPNEENRDILDFVAETVPNVKETISNLVSHDERIISSISPSSFSDESADDIQQSENLDHDKDGQTKDDRDDKIVSIQKQVNQNPERLVTSSYPLYSSQYKVAATEHDRLSSIDSSSFSDHKQHDEPQKKSLSQQIQVLNDDYPWYSSYYTIVDAEARFARLYKQISTINKQEDISNSSNITDNMTSHIIDAVSSITNFLPTSESIKEDLLSTESVITHTEDQSLIVKNDTVISSTSPEETQTKEIDNQQQLSSTGLLERIKNLLPSQLLSNTATEKDSETTKSVVKDEQTEVLKTTLQPSNEKEHSVFDFVAETIFNVEETISNLVSHDEKTVASESPSKISNKSNDDNQQLEHINNDKNEQTNVELIQEQVIENPKHPITSDYTPHPSQYKVAATEYDRLSTTDEPSNFSRKEQNDIEKPLSSQQLQVIHDDYRWYSNHYTIVDAEAKFAQLDKQWNLSNEQSIPPIVLEVSTELHNEKEDDVDDFRVVQRRKRIPSSTTHEKIISSTMSTPKSMLSPDIDLEPVILHGHPNASIPTSPIALQTTGTTNKRKHKKKKKDKEEMILFDAPERTLSDMNKEKIDVTQSQTEEQQHQKNIKINDSVLVDQTFNHELEQSQLSPMTISDDQKFETLLTTIISNTKESNQIDEKINESTSSNISQLLSTPVTTFPQNDKVNAQTIEQTPTDKESIPQSSPSTTETIHKKVIASPKEDDDNEGFQLVRYRKRILSTPKADQTPSSTPTSKELPSVDINQKTSVILEQQNLPTLTMSDTQSSTSKKKKNKHKKHKKEIDSLSTVDSSKITQESVDQKPSFQSHISSSTSNTEDSNEQPSSILPPVINPTPLRTKPSAPAEEEQEEEDNEGFQVVTYRKRITSASGSVNTALSSAGKTRYEQNNSGNIAHRSVALHGRHGSASPSVSRTNINTKTGSNQIKEVRSKQDQKPVSLLNTSRSASAEMQSIKQKANEHQQKLKDSEHELILDVKPKLEQSTSKKQSTKKIVKEHPTSKKSNIESTVLSAAVSASNTDPEKSKLKEDDNEGLQVTHSHVPKPSSTTSTISEQSNRISTIDQKSTDTYANNESSSPSNITPEIIIPQTTTTTTTTSRKESKKSKISKNDTQPPLTTDIDSTPLSVEETIDQNVNNSIQNVPESQITPANNSSNLNETTLINTTYETMTPEINQPIYQIDDTQSSLHSIKSAASTTTAVEEISISSNEQPGEVNDFSIVQTVPSTNISQEPSTDIPSAKDQIQNEIITKEVVPTTNTEDEHVQKTSSKKASKRRKKKSHPKEKLDEEHVSTSCTNTVVTETNAHRIEDVNQEPNSNTISKTNPIETTTTTTTTQSFHSSANPSTILSEEMNNKLDRFLPEYIRQQINTHETHSSTSILSDTIQKKKPRLKMLKKDHEVKSLLTNEFDTEKQSTEQINSINDDNEYNIQNVHPNTPNKSKDNAINISSEPTIDNILSRGFYLWLQESQAISQEKDNLTNIMQSIVIQPVTTNDDEEEDEDSWNVSKMNKPTYMIGVRPEKRIHVTNAYLINHPAEFLSKPSWLIAQSNDDTFQDHSEKFNSDNDDDSMNNDTSKIQTNSTTNNIQQDLSKDFYHRINTNPSMNFDDWAHFLEEKNSYHIGDDLSTSLECFYTETYDEDTLLSDAKPIHHSIKNERQRYGDFLSSNNDECIIQRPLYKSKPSEYFQNWQKQELISLSYQDNDGDDEILISHSNDGLSRRVKP